MISPNNINYWAIPSVRKQNLSPRQRQAIANDIIDKVCTYYNISIEQIKGRKRYKTVIMARHMSMFLLRNRLKLKLKDIAKMYGRDHSTVIHSIASIQDQSDVDVDVRADIQNLMNIL
jgi:chromosomal replication initiator protein